MSQRPPGPGSGMMEAQVEAMQAARWLTKVFGGRFGLLLFSLVFLLLISPPVIEHEAPDMFLGLVASGVMIASIHAARPAGRAWGVGVGLAVGDFVIGRLVYLDNGRWLVYIQAALWISSTLFVIKAILDVIFRSRKVTVHTLQAALCVYLLSGLLFSYIYATLDLIIPGSFASHGQPLTMWTDNVTRHHSFLRFLLFSFSTQSVGSYDGLTPVTGFASMCSYLQNMTAQIYLAVVIARLVGMQTSDLVDAQP